LPQPAFGWCLPDGDAEGKAPLRGRTAAGGGTHTGGGGRGGAIAGPHRGGAQGGTGGNNATNPILRTGAQTHAGSPGAPHGGWIGLDWVRAKERGGRGRGRGRGIVSRWVAAASAPTRSPATRSEGRRRAVTSYCRCDSSKLLTHPSGSFPAGKPAPQQINREWYIFLFVAYGVFAKTSHNPSTALFHNNAISNYVLDEVWVANI